MLRAVSQLGLSFRLRAESPSIFGTMTCTCALCMTFKWDIDVLNTLPGSFKQNVLVPLGKSKESTVSLPDSSEKNYEENKLLPSASF